MTWRRWLAVLGLGIGLTLGTGCSRPGLRAPAPTPLPEPRAAAQPIPPTNDSPYHALPAPAPQPALKPPDDPVPPEPIRPPQLPPPAPIRPVEALPVKSVSMPKPLPDHALVEALRCLLKEDPDPKTAQAHLERYDQLTQDMLMVLLALSGLLAEEGLERIPPAELVHVVEQLDDLLDQLRARSPLVIDKMLFCRRIERYGYGVYDPLPAEHVFRPGDPVQVYLELRNFTTERLGQQYVTHLSSRLEVHDFQKAIQYEQNFPEEQGGSDLSWTPRQDYFARLSFCIPRNIPPGKYTLWIKVTDAGKPGQEPASRSLDFRVGR